MTYTTVFHLVSDISKKEDVSTVLIGGFAVNYYKVTRQTADVDFLITKEDYEKILPHLESMGYKQDYLQEVFVRLKGAGLFLMDIDFMFVDKETMDKVVKDGKKVNIAKQEFIVPSLNNLIALKLHSLKYNPKLREGKDMADILDLIRINELDYKSEEFHRLCLRYGTEEIYQKIIARA
jgi:hypothetical protein